MAMELEGDVFIGRDEVYERSRGRKPAPLRDSIRGRKSDRGWWPRETAPSEVLRSAPILAPQLAARPHRMVKVDNIRVLVLEGSVLVWMAMRLLSLPAFMCVLMVFVMDMQVLVLKRLVQVFHLAGVVSRPPLIAISGLWAHRRKWSTGR